MRARADTEYKRLQNMMATLEVAQNRFGAGQDEDRVRLREEHARLEAMQVSLETERTMVRQELSKDRDALRADRAAFEAERRAWRTQCATEKSTFEGRKTQLDAIEASHHEWELQLRRDGEDLKRRMRAFEEQRSSSMKQMEEEVELNREKSSELERMKLELDMERTAMEVDKKNMKQDTKKWVMQQFWKLPYRCCYSCCADCPISPSSSLFHPSRLTALGIELRKQSQELSDAQHVVIQERMKNEQHGDISEYHAEASKNGARLDTAAMQLHMAKKRQASVELHGNDKEAVGARSHKVEHTAQTRRGSAGLLEIPPSATAKQQYAQMGSKTQPQ